MKIRRQINKQKKNYSGKDARKNYWGWTSTASSSSEGKTIEVKSVKEHLLELIQIAEEKGYSLEEFRVQFGKVTDSTTRMEVTFDVDSIH